MIHAAWKYETDGGQFRVRGTEERNCETVIVTILTDQGCEYTVEVDACDWAEISKLVGDRIEK